MDRALHEARWNTTPKRIRREAMTAEEAAKWQAAEDAEVSKGQKEAFERRYKMNQAKQAAAEQQAKEDAERSRLEL